MSLQDNLRNFCALSQVKMQFYLEVQRIIRTFARIKFHSYGEFQDTDCRRRAAGTQGY